MKIKLFLPALALLLCLVSCNTDFDVCTQTVSYTKATAIFENLPELRATPLVESVREVENAGKIFVGDNFLLIGEENKGIHVFNNTDARSPSASSFLNIPYSKEFFVLGSTIYAESHYDMVKIDISDLNDPKIIARSENVIPASNMAIQGDQLLVGFIYEDIVETLSCDTPIEAGSVNFFIEDEFIPASNVPSSFAGNSSGSIGTINRISIANGHCFLISNEDLYILSEEDLSQVASLQRFDRGMETIYALENSLFIGKTDGMSIIDISSPSNPTRRADYSHRVSCDPVLPFDGFAYITLRSGGDCPGDTDVLDVIDLNGTNSQFNLNSIQQIEMLSPYGMTILDDKLYVGEGENGLKVFDITDRSNPQLLEWSTEVEAYDVIVHPTKNILLTAGPTGLNQYLNTETLTLTYLSTVSY